MAADYSTQLARLLKVKIGHVLEVSASEWVTASHRNLHNRIYNYIKTFQRAEKGIWNDLGKGAFTKNINGVTVPDRTGWSKEVSIDGDTRKLNSNLHKFQNRTHEMKNYTGYIILFDGKIITGRNRLLSAHAVKGQRWQNPNIKGQYALPLSNIARGYGETLEGKIDKRYRGKNDGFRKMVNVSIAIFADSEHAFYVDNPAPQKRSPYTQGTGWFRRYAQEVANKWMFFVIEPALHFIANYSYERGASEGYIGNLTKNETTWEERLTERATKLSDIETKNRGTFYKINSSYKAWQATSTGTGTMKRGKHHFDLTYGALKFSKKGIKLDIPIILTRIKDNSNAQKINKNRIADTWFLDY